MAAKSGAGASVASGAGYQARVGAYLFASVISDAENRTVKAADIYSIGFETTEAIDDINVDIVNGSKLYIQAKAQIDFSIGAGGEFRSVLSQFVGQQIDRPNEQNDRFMLVTSAKSSKKIVYDCRAALDAFRLSDRHTFERDQPRALIQIIEAAVSAIKEILFDKGQDESDETAERILRKSYIQILDLEDECSLVQGILLLMQARSFSVVSALWGKIISDCIDHAKSRHTLSAKAILKKYERFKLCEGKDKGIIPLTQVR